MNIFLLGLTLLLLGAAAHAKVEEEEAAVETAAKVEGVTVKPTNDAKIKESIKPKRDASHSIGGGGSPYHGPSYKYLPPTTSVVIGYDGYRGSAVSSAAAGGGGGGSRHHVHGNALSSASGYDFGSLADSYNYRHHGSGGSSSSSGGGGNGGIYHAPTKVETYIVQTEHGSGGAGGAHSGGVVGGGHHYTHGPQGYKYVSTGSSGYTSNSAGSLSLSHHGLGGSAGGASSLGLGQHKLHSVYAIPAPTPVHYQPAVHSGYASFLHKPSSAGSVAIGGGAATHGHGHGYELGLEHVSGHSHSQSDHGSGSSASGFGYHYAPTSTPVVEHIEETVPAHGYFSSGSSSGSGSSSDVGHQAFFGSQHDGSSESAIGSTGASGFGGTSLIAGYNYAVPTLPFSILRKPQAVLTNSYGAPTSSSIASAPSVYEEHQPPQEQHNGHGQIQIQSLGHSHGQSADDVTPVYALGHKGLGHFSYMSSKPQALHTDIVAAAGSASSKGHASVSSAANGYAHGDISKAPFRPSVFLGAKHESSASSSGSAVTGDDVYYATPTAQYLPPTSGGYEYQAPSLIYGAPTHSGDSAVPIYEPESTYLPPAHH